jgi:hypothetical protein
MAEHLNSNPDLAPHDESTHVWNWALHAKRSVLTLVAVGLIVVGGLGDRIVSAASTPSNQVAVQSTTGTTNRLASSRAAGAPSGSNARSGPEEGGASGTVGTVSASSFTLTTAGGETVTVDETSTTIFKRGTNAISASAVKTGKSVLVLGTTNGTTIVAKHIIVAWQPTRSAATAGVVPFQRGSQSASKSVGQIPANYTEGSGTIVSGTTANKATKAALASYPGGIVDRVVKLSNGEYEVHNIGVNWPHHVFVNQNFKVVGAN